MTQDEIIRMAREAGFDVREGYVAYCYIDDLKTFAERVAAAAKVEEREECAKMCDGWLHADGDVCAAAICARG